MLRTVPMDPGPLTVDERTGHVFVATITNSGSSLVPVLDARSGCLLSTASIGSAGSYPVTMVADAHIRRVVMATGNGCTCSTATVALCCVPSPWAALGSAFAAIAVDAQAGHAYVVGQVNAGGSTATLPGNGGGSILAAWSAQARRWLPWLPRPAPLTPVPSGSGLLSVLDATR